MSVVWEDAYGRLWQGDVRACLAALPAASVQCVVTSPPYWGLRAYGTEPQIWGGSPDCDHGEADMIADGTVRRRDWQHLPGATTNNAAHPNAVNHSQGWAPAPALPPMTGGSAPASAKQVTNAGSQFGNAWREHATVFTGPPGSDKQASNYGANGVVAISAHCTRCGAWRGELGSEPVHDCAGWATGAPCGQCFICHLLEVFTAVRRVLRPDGVLFVVIGDSYAGSGKGPSNSIQPEASQIGGRRNLAQCSSGQAPTEWHSIPNGLKPKDLCGIPWRFALAMQAAGWWLRGDYIWSKPNPMPESVTDRCTRSHEYVFHFTQSERYYWDADSVREAHAGDWYARASTWRNGQAKQQQRGETYHGFTEAAPPFSNPPNPAGRNARSVWEIATEAFPGSHFATFPTALVRRCIQAATSERGACAVCGSPYRRVTDRAQYGSYSDHQHDHDQGMSQPQPNNLRGGKFYANYQPPTTVAWQPTCTCDCPDTRPCIVLDPFAGSGTTVAVARQLGRIGWGVELNESYVAMSIKRLQQMVLL